MVTVLSTASLCHPIESKCDAKNVENTCYVLIIIVRVTIVPIIFPVRVSTYHISTIYQCLIFIYHFTRTNKMQRRRAEIKLLMKNISNIGYRFHDDLAKPIFWHVSALDVE